MKINISIFQLFYMSFLFALEIAFGLRPQAIPRAKTIFHGMSLLSSTYCISMLHSAFQHTFCFACFHQVIKVSIALGKPSSTTTPL